MTNFLFLGYNIPELYHTIKQHLELFAESWGRWAGIKLETVSAAVHRATLRALGINRTRDCQCCCPPCYSEGAGHESNLRLSVLLSTVLLWGRWAWIELETVSAAVHRATRAVSAAVHRATLRALGMNRTRDCQCCCPPCYSEGAGYESNSRLSVLLSTVLLWGRWAWIELETVSAAVHRATLTHLRTWKLRTCVKFLRRALTSP
jgi:ribosomal protein L30/L7E